MLVADIISRVRGITGDTTAAQFDNATVLSWINDGIRECVTDNTLLQKSGTVASVVGQQSYPLPTDILKLHSVKYNGQKLEVLTLQEYDQRYDDNNVPSGVPSVCYVWAGNLVFDQKPTTATDQIKIDYIRQPTDITTPDAGTTFVPTTPDLPVGYHNRLVDYCLAQVAQQDDDMNRYAVKMEEFRTGTQNLKDLPEYENDLYAGVSTSTRDMGNDYGDYYYG